MSSTTRLVSLFKGGYSGEALTITANGTYDVRQYAKATVSVSGGSEESGMLLEDFVYMVKNNTYVEGTIYTVVI